MLVTDSLLAYTLAATLLTLTPGLDTALILRTATAEGGRKALHAALGIDLGCFIWGALVAFGLGALLGEPAEFGKNRTLRFSGHP
ncbi:translocator protein, LysE family [Klebsiella pneumoniae]|nr:translocator protein, LysE family [Klebsiella pneumoniae]